MPNPKDTIAAVRIYVDYDAIKDVLKKIPKPWQEYHHDTCRIASSNNHECRDGWEVKCWAELPNGQTKESLEQDLLGALTGRWIIEDILRLEKEREIIAKLRRERTKTGEAQG